MTLQNIGNCLLADVVQHPLRFKYSAVLLWEPQQWHEYYQSGINQNIQTL